MVATTESIADDLMRSIKSNDAIAIDISILKTSDEYTFKHSVDVATISMIVAKQQDSLPKKYGKSVSVVCCTTLEKPKFQMLS